ncbi:MAG: glycoside hydrolase family 18 protein [Bacteroidetes bacterium]|nr:glycoside hydrolase family 18 protein [Bacteroidota bacterium]
MNIMKHYLWMIVLLLLMNNNMSVAQHKSKPVIIGYVGGYNGQLINPDSIEAKRLSHINYAFVDIKDNKAWLHNEQTDTINFRSLNSLKRKNPNLKILISIGGWTWSKNFSDAMLTDTSTQQFAESAVAIVAQYDLDGIDIDWEYPGMIGDNNKYRDEDRQNYTRMFQYLRKHLDQLSNTTKKKYLVTTAIGGSREFLQHTEMKKVQRYTDFINVMSYDFDGTYDTIAAHHTNLYNSKGHADMYSADVSIQNLMKAGVPSSKIVIGIGFYGKGKIVASTDNNGLYAKAVKPIFGGGYTYLKDSLVNQKGYVRYWDDGAKAPYLFNADKKIFITYDDEESVKAKCNYVRKHKLAGAMFWEYFSDKKLYLLKTIDKEFGY